MKKILLFSFFILSSVAMTSCTADSIADSAPAPHLVNADGGGQTGPTIPPKP
jgi:hypothetical protein